MSEPDGKGGFLTMGCLSSILDLVVGVLVQLN